MPIKTILLVDDSPTERFYLAEILKRSGYQIEMAESGEDGVAKAKLLKPDLVLMDVVMPGMNGFQATRLLSKDAETSHIPVVMCTTKGEVTDKVWGMRQGAAAYLVKPIVAEELLGVIQRLG
jgi:twitching motility two-component system response regulator PilH